MWDNWTGRVTKSCACSVSKVTRLQNLEEIGLNSKVKTLALVAILGSVITVGHSQSKPQAHKGAAETTLLGVSLFDTGQKLIAKFGSPNEIQGLSLGTSAGGGNAPSSGGRSGPTAGGAGATGPGRAPGSVSGTGQGPSAAGVGGNIVGDPFDTGKTLWQMRAPGAGNGGDGELGEVSQRGGGKGGGGNPAGGTTQGSGSVVQFTRWVYNKGTSRYAFVLDKFNRVVQIEAFGLWDSRVKTKRGAKFGTTFGQLIQKYSAPDGYELNGDTIVMRYLNRDRVAFRLQRTDAKKPHMVTGVVVAAGK